MSLNATALPPRLVHPTAAELYSAAGTDLDSLSTVERWWAQWYLYFGDPIIATGMLSFVLHEVSLPHLSTCPLAYPPPILLSSRCSEFNPPIFDRLFISGAAFRG